ncbi:beta-alanine-activating enzyme [Phlebotomus argentipes]|uniref:beta-alanine-activating enzyme n=1 Tax=Phlebotomus argentipes TaxID=94469 RepID=UPI002892E4F3|nr:beta-alanine-activating enzyme [Phlebotomus argentipes]
MDIPGVFEKMLKSEKPALIHCNDHLDLKYTTYRHLVRYSLAISCELNCLVTRKCVILVILPQPTSSYLLYPVLLGIINSNCSFFCTNWKTADNLQCFLEKHKINFFISQHHPKNLFGGEKYVNCREVGIFENESVFICQHRQNQEEITAHVDDIAYWMETSGSTGTPKIVRVPWSCILPNISAINQRLNLTANDVIYSTSPATFDPFIVDLLLGILNSATILVATDRLRIAPSRKFAEQLFVQTNKVRVTFLQMTPTILTNFGQQVLKEVVFAPESSLKICLLGGESFPKKSLMKCINDRVKIFNIYGITEISCWSHMKEVNLVDDEEVDIGEPLDESIQVEIRDKQLWIGSKSRKCLLDGENEISNEKTLFRNTGDIVEVKNEKIFIRSRSNKIIKRFGKQVNLAQIEQSAMKIDMVERSHGLFLQDCRRIILFYQSEKEEVNLLDKLKETLSSAENPDEAVRIDAFPQSNHGKVSEEKLLDFYRKIQREKCSIDSIEDEFLRLIKQLVQPQISLSTSFPNLGGDSMKALRLVCELQNKYNREFADLLQMLLNPDLNLQCILNYVKDSSKSIQREAEETFKSSNIPNTKTSLELKFSWRANLGKCVDATPSILSTSVTVGSHSHKLMTLNCETGEILFEEVLSDRIESQVAFCSGFGFVGCYRGYLYKFSIGRKEIVWKFDSGAMIKCRPLVLSEVVIFGNYSHEQNVWCLSKETGNVMWCRKVGDKGILANPLHIRIDNILVATLDGSVEILDTKTGNQVFQTHLKAPIFSSPAIVEFSAKEVKIVIAEVNGTINTFTVAENHTLQPENPFKVSGNIFSSFTVFNQSANSALVAFGCHNSCIYCLRVRPEDSLLSLEWKTRLASPIFSTPCRFAEAFLCCCTTSGQLTILCAEVGQVKSSQQLPGEAFSSPVARGRQIFIGCRDNHLYCYTV